MRHYFPVSGGGKPHPENYRTVVMFKVNMVSKRKLLVVNSLQQIMPVIDRDL
ncbi:MAG: hypothetical protein JWP88_1227 [Flaviaesturariibacter sp.]|nr:hypothetical protein [Flaviaesturariibacter sp.]